MKIILELELNVSLYNTNRITYAFEDKHTFDNYHIIDGVTKPIIIPESYYNKYKFEIPAPHFPYEELKKDLLDTKIIQIDISSFQTSHPKMEDKVKYFRDKIKTNTVFNFIFNEDELFNKYLLTAISLQVAAKQLRQEAETTSELPDNYFDLSASEKQQHDASYTKEQLKLKLLFPMRSIDNYELNMLN